MNNQHLLYLKIRARELTSACQAMDTLFANGAARLRQEADARRLETFAANFAKHLNEEEWRENVERLRSDEDKDLEKGGEFVAATIGFVLKGSNGMKAVNKEMQTRHAGRKRYRGVIVVCVGADGLPGDVTIVPVSRLARTQNREEPEIIRELQQQGGRLFYPEAFCRMLTALVDDIRIGKLQLPISLKQLPAKLAIPRKITVGFPVSFQSDVTGHYHVVVVPQLPPGKDTSTQI